MCSQRLHRHFYCKYSYVRYVALCDGDLDHFTSGAIIMHYIIQYLLISSLCAFLFLAGPGTWRLFKGLIHPN